MNPTNKRYNYHPETFAQENDRQISHQTNNHLMHIYIYELSEREDERASKRNEKVKERGLIRGRSYLTILSTTLSLISGVQIIVRTI